MVATRMMEDEWKSQEGWSDMRVNGFDARIGAWGGYENVDGRIWRAGVQDGKSVRRILAGGRGK